MAQLRALVETLHWELPSLTVLALRSIQNDLSENKIISYAQLFLLAQRSALRGYLPVTSCCVFKYVCMSAGRWPVLAVNCRN
jgi:hypothetical protein